jgi:hypothetical protein
MSIPLIDQARSVRPSTSKLEAKRERSAENESGPRYVPHTRKRSRLCREWLLRRVKEEAPQGDTPASGGRIRHGIRSVNFWRSALRLGRVVTTVI